MVLYWFSENRLRKKQPQGLALARDHAHQYSIGRRVFFHLGCLLCSIGAHKTSIKSLLHGEQDDVKLETP